MKWLVLGGTRFLGRTFVERALAAGHEVTLFNRGKTGPELFPEVETITGDRTSADDLAKLAGRRWDAVFDPSGYVPRVVRMSADALASSANYYVFVSSISVYRDHSTAGADETYPLATLEDTSVEEITGETYGALKALCEQTVQEVFPDKSLIVRAGLIVGPYDPTNRFTYWATRVQKGGEFIAPEGPQTLMQIIDASDIADWVLRMAESGRAGIYNVTGDPITVGSLIETVRSVTGADATPVYMDAEFLAAQNVEPWQELPLWIPATNEQFAHMNETGVDKAKHDGLTTRPLADTVRDLLEWENAQTNTEPSRHGLAEDKERSVLQAWHARDGQE